MALTIKQLLNYSWMSQASYLDFNGLTQNDLQALRNKLQESTINLHNEFVDKQASAFTNPIDGFSFVSHAPNYQDTGFSATVFKSNTDNSYTIAVRGTEPELFNSADLTRADALGVVLQKGNNRGQTPINHLLKSLSR